MLFSSIDFVVPDNLLAELVLALPNKGLAECKDRETCYVNVDSCPSPPPAVHFHFGSEYTVGIYRQSSTSWFLPTLELSPNPTLCSSDIILASHLAHIFHLRAQVESALRVERIHYSYAFLLRIGYWKHIYVFWPRRRKIAFISIFGCLW